MVRTSGNGKHIVGKRMSRAPSRRTHSAQRGDLLSEDKVWTEGTSRRVAPKAHLFVHGDVKTHAYKVVSGALCLYRVLVDGRRQIVEFALEGDIIGLDSAPVERVNAQAIAETTLLCLPHVVVLNAARRHSEVALRLYEAISGELEIARQHVLCLGSRGACERLATFLIVLSRRSRARGNGFITIDLPMTRTDIADFLGLTIETVSRTFSLMKRQGLIEIERTTTIRLRNTEELRRIAEGEARV